MASDVMRFYGMSLPQLKALPIGTFWSLVKNAEKIRASEDIRFISAISCLFSEENTHYSDLVERVGGIVETEEPDSGFDRAGFERLRAMFAAHNRPQPQE